MLVLDAPMSTTHALDIPAPYVAARDSYMVFSAQCAALNSEFLIYLLYAYLFETHRYQEKIC